MINRLCFLIIFFFIHLGHVYSERNLNLPNPLFSMTHNGNTLTLQTSKSSWFYPAAGFKSFTTGFNLTNCPLAQNGFCQFAVSDTLSRSITIAGPAIRPTFVACLNGTGDTYSCEYQLLGERLIYVGNSNNNTLSLCSINSSHQITGCINPGATFTTPLSVVINSTGTKLYVTNDNNTISVCSISSTGLLTCGTPYNSTLFDGLFGITLSKNQRLAYVSNYTNNTVLVCTLDSNGNFISCQDSGVGPSFYGPSSIVLNHNETLAYVASNDDNVVFTCNILPNGFLSSCTSSARMFNVPVGVYLNKNGTAYVTNANNNTISFCQINYITGVLEYCQNATGNNTFDAPAGISLSYDGLTAYISNGGSNSLFICPILPNKLLGTCQVNNLFNGPVGIALA